MNQSLVNRLKLEFEQAYRTQPELTVQAPGRVNLIGEHTDYNDGFVLPCALGFSSYVAVSKRTDQEVHLCALDYDKESSVFHLGEEINYDQKYLWSNYIRGVFQVLIDRDYQLSGVSLMLVGDVPQGAGLSSSAALEVAVTFALSSLFNLGLSPTEIAQVAQKSENDFVGCQCGIMDQLASAMGESQHALLIDCRSLEVKQIAMPSELAIVIIHSGVQRGLVDSAYNQRRLECEQAARLLGVSALRDVSLEEVLAQQNQFDELTFKRARHVVSENERTLLATEALQVGDVQKLAQLMAESHHSLDHDYEVTVEPLNILVSLIKEVIGDQGGARMTGGGFGGCVIALCPHELVNPLKIHVLSKYTNLSGLQATIYTCSAERGARVLLPEY